MKRIPEPRELMDDADQALAYAQEDFAEARIAGASLHGDPPVYNNEDFPWVRELEDNCATAHARPHVRAQPPVDALSSSPNAVAALVHTCGGGVINPSRNSLAEAEAASCQPIMSVLCSTR